MKDVTQVKKGCMMIWYCCGDSHFFQNLVMLCNNRIVIVLYCINVCRFRKIYEYYACQIDTHLASIT